MKRKNIFIAIGVILLIGTICYFLHFNTTTKNSSINLLDDGIYFIKWQAYHGYLADDQPFIQLNLVQIHKENNEASKPSYMNYILVSDKGELAATPTGFNPGPGGDEYSFYTLGLTLPKLNAGIYKFNKLKLIDAEQNETQYDIGNWIFDIRDYIVQDDISIGKKSFVSSSFDFYKIELMNNTSAIMNIENLEFSLNTDYSVSIITADNFYMDGEISKDLSLKSKQQKTFKFEFNKVSGDKPYQPEFISLKPFLIYNINSKRMMFTLGTAIYSPEVDDKKLIELIKPK